MIQARTASFCRERDPEVRNALRQARRERIAGVWERFCFLVLMQGLVTADYLIAVPDDPDRRRGFMLPWFERRLPAGWRFVNVLEAAEFCMEENRFGLGTFHGRRTDPTGAWPGSEDKIAVLSERIERGQELWHPEDRTDFLAADGSLSWLMSRLWPGADRPLPPGQFAGEVDHVEDLA